MNLADEHNKGIADILSIMGQVAAIADGVIVRRRQDRRQDARDRQAQANFELQFNANRQYREEALAQELGVAEANRAQRQSEFDATMRFREAEASDERERANMRSARDELTASTQSLEAWMNIDKVNRLEFEKAKERFVRSVYSYDDKGNAVFASGALRALFSTGPVKKAMKQQGVTPEDVAALAAAAATRGATGSFSAVAEALPEGPLRTAILASKALDAADADWAQRMIPQAESYRGLYYQQRASGEHVAGLQTRLRAVEDVVDAARASGSMRDYGWAGDFYDRIDAIGEPDDTLAGKSTDEQAAVLAPEDWLGRSPGDSASPQSGYAGQPRELQGGGKMSWLGGAVTYEPKAKPFSADNPRMAPVYTEPSFVESLRGEMAPGVNQGALERMRQELSPPGAWKYTPADSPEDDLRRLIGLEVGGLR